MRIVSACALCIPEASPAQSIAALAAWAGLAAGRVIAVTACPPAQPMPSANTNPAA
ncbi:MAG TPA: hypothetical protein VE443_03870 [Beijerinckiaceae bacterium]|nr:hypothetical protein [Beijerinckiaceae bacterium]